MDPLSSSVETFSPATADELSRFVEENATGAKRPLFPVGGRTALHYGYPRAADDVTLAMSDLNEVVDYPARDMTITVGAGMRIEQLQTILATEGQRLPIDIPQAHRATIGGAIATNTSGPGRFGHGTLRDYVIGISAVDGRGRLFSAGGRVVKNVAGYDLCKLLVGSLGTLAVITQVTLKLRPQAPARKCLWATSGQPRQIEQALAHLLTSRTRPVAVEVLNPASVRQLQRESKLDVPIDRFVLCLAYEGSPAEVDWQLATVREELSASPPEEVHDLTIPQSKALWSALTEYQAASDDPLTFQANVPPSGVIQLLEEATDAGVAVQSHAGNGIIIGHLPDRYSTAQTAAGLLNDLRRSAISLGGALRVLSCDDEWTEHLQLFGAPHPAAMLDARIKQTLDPDNLLSRGQMG